MISQSISLTKVHWVNVDNRNCTLSHNLGYLTEIADKIFHLISCDCVISHVRLVHCPGIPDQGLLTLEDEISTGTKSH
jgi:hypothetical protein